MRLLRPHIPLAVRCMVALRQLGQDRLQQIINTEPKLVKRYGGYERYLKAFLLPRLRSKLGAEALHLDHDPALENRRRIFIRTRGSGLPAVFSHYSPHANDPDFLIYREKHAHHIKTNVRGDHGQFADNVIAKRERRRAKKATKRKHKWPKGRKLQSRNTLRKR